VLADDPETFTAPAADDVLTAWVETPVPVMADAVVKYFAAPSQVLPPDCSVLTVQATVSVWLAEFAE
jgi:hypothetical protein